MLLLSYIGGIGAVLLILLIVGFSLTWFIRLLINGFLGGLLLLIFNVIGEKLGFAIPLNPITAVLAGFTGIPGVLVMALLAYLSRGGI